MDKDQVLWAVGLYDAKLESMGMGCVKEGVRNLEHARWLCREIQRLILEEAGSTEEVLWDLGLLQGILWAESLYNMNELIEHRG